MALVNSFINVFFEKVPLEVFSIRSHFIIIFLSLFFIARIRRKKIHCRKTAWKRPKTARIAGEKRRRSFPPRHAARKRWSEINGFSRFTPEMKRCASVWPFFIVFGRLRPFPGRYFRPGILIKSLYGTDICEQGHSKLRNDKFSSRP